jgi:hypothetical protein
MNKKKLSPINYTGSYAIYQTYFQDYAEDILVGGAAGVVPVAEGGKGLQDEVNGEYVHAGEVLLVEGVEVDPREFVDRGQVIVEAP